MKIVIIVSGGVVQDVLADSEVEIKVIDYDIDSIAAEEDLTTLKFNDGFQQQAIVYEVTASQQADFDWQNL